MIVLYNCPGMMSEDAPQWRALLTRLVPSIDFRVWPDIGRPEEIEFILAWKHKPGDLKRYPNAKAIFWLGAGVDHLVKDSDLPRQVPIVRLVDDGLTRSMTEYVVQLQVRDARSGEVVAKYSTGLRMGANYSWSRGVRSLMKNEMLATE